MMTTAMGSNSRSRNQNPAGARSRAVASRPASFDFFAAVKAMPAGVVMGAQADLKRAMISARSGLVSVAAAPNSSGVNDSAAGNMIVSDSMSGGSRSSTRLSATG